MPDCDRNVQAATVATCQWAEQFNLDIIKMMPNGMYMLEDFFGVCFDDVAKGGIAQITNPIDSNSSAQLARLIEQLVETSVGDAVQREIQILRNVRTQLGNKILLFTSFMPSTLLCKLLKHPMLENHHIDMIENSGLLQYLTDYVIRIHSLAINNGADGIFLANRCLATTPSQRTFYCKYLRGYDQAVISALAEHQHLFNVLHCHGAWHYPHLYDLDPISAISFHVKESSVTIDYVTNTMNKIVFSGISREFVKADKLSNILEDITALHHSTSKIIYAPNCALCLPYDEGIILRITEHIHSLNIQHREFA